MTAAGEVRTNMGKRWLARCVSGQFQALCPPLSSGSPSCGSPGLPSLPFSSHPPPFVFPFLVRRTKASSLALPGAAAAARAATPAAAASPARMWRSSGMCPSSCRRAAPARLPPSLDSPLHRRVYRCAALHHLQEADGTAPKGDGLQQRLAPKEGRGVGSAGPSLCSPLPLCPRCAGARPHVEQSGGGGTRGGGAGGQV